MCAAVQPPSPSSPRHHSGQAGGPLGRWGWRAHTAATRCWSCTRYTARPAAGSGDIGGRSQWNSWPIQKIETWKMKAYSFAQWLYIFSIQTFDCLLLVSYYRFINLIYLPAMISLVYPQKKIQRCCLFSQTVDHSLNCLHWDLLRGFIYAREISPNLMCESPQKTI